MLCALTNPVPDERTDLGAIFPSIVAMTFIFDDEIVDVGVSVACTPGVIKESAPAAPATTMATSARLM